MPIHPQPIVRNDTADRRRPSKRKGFLEPTTKRGTGTRSQLGNSLH